MEILVNHYISLPAMGHHDYDTHEIPRTLAYLFS